VSCTKRTFCMAVGTEVLTEETSVTLAEIWRGKRWVITPTPPLPLSQDSLDAVSCSWPADCTAVGSQDAQHQLLIERWQGARWAIQSAPTPAGSTFSTLSSVSCVSRKWCMAVGNYKAASGGIFEFAELWAGGRWSILPTKEIPDNAIEFAAVSCTSQVSCTVVGDYGTSESEHYPLAERWNGKVWTIQTVPHAEGQLNSMLTAVWCSSARACTAVGQYFTEKGPIYTFGESWNGRVWVLRPTVNPSEDNNSLFGVACTSATACTAVGGYAGPESVSRSLIERYSARRCRFGRPAAPAGDRAMGHAGD
jgi:hypothetical protein